MDLEEDSKINEYKIVLIGNNGVGKTHLLTRFLYNTFSYDQTSTLSATYATKKIKTYNDDEIILQIWDTAGQETYRGLSKLFFKGAAGIVIVYDITNKESFDDIKKYWYKQVEENALSKVKVAIVGNKYDLFLNEKVNEKEAKSYANEIGALFQLTSALDARGVEDLFIDLGSEFKDPDYYLANNNDSIRLSNKKKMLKS